MMTQKTMNLQSELLSRCQLKAPVRVVFNQRRNNDVLENISPSTVVQD